MNTANTQCIGLVKKNTPSTTQNGIEVTKLWVEVPNGAKSSYLQVACWRGLAGIAQQYMPVGSWIDVSGNIEVEAYTGQDGSVKHNLVLTVMDFEFMPKNATPTTGFLQTLVTGNVGNDVTVKDITPKAGPYAGQTVPVAEARIAMTQSWKDKGDGSRKEKTVWAVVKSYETAAYALLDLAKGQRAKIVGVPHSRGYTDEHGAAVASLEITPLLITPLYGANQTAPTVDEEAIPLEPEYMPADLTLNRFLPR